MVYNIQRYCIHDGQGIRTTVFLKGCQFSCPWCANPESQDSGREIAFNKNKCIGCGACVKACPKGKTSPDNIPDGCDLCGRCEYACPREAIQIYGWDMPPDELVEEVAKDSRYFRRSGGGVTISGGEPTLQMDYIAEVFGKLHDLGIHTAIESHGHFSDGDRERLIPLVDQFLIDLKHMDSKKHEEYTGYGNEQVLRNLEKLKDHGLTIRIPLIPGFNDDDDNLRKSAEFAKKLGVPVNLLKFHNMASSKYESLGRNYAYKDVGPQTAERLEHMLGIFTDMGVEAQIGG